MNSEKLHDWLQLVGMAAIVVSLVFVGLQLRQSQHDALAQLSLNSVIVGTEISSLVAEHSDVWIKACAGEELSPSEQLIANNIYFRYIQDNFNSWLRTEFTEIGLIDASFFVDAAAANIYRYPGLRKMALSYDDWAKLGARAADAGVMERYGEQVRNRLSELAKEEPNPNADLTWCGVR